MAQKKSKQRSKVANSAVRGRNAHGFWWTFIKIFLGLILVLSTALGIFATTHFLKLDRVVRQRLEGRRFDVPSKVLSAPTILYAGLDWQRMDLLGLLKRQGYRSAPPGKELELGYYRSSAGALRIHLRAFEHPSRAEPARDVLLKLSGPLVEEIREVSSGREMAAVLIEPEPIGAYYGPDREQRELVQLSDVPRHLIDAVLAVEDKRFEQHHGLDPLRIVGAFLANLKAGDVREGGSTLTQQLVKNFFLTSERTYRRKIQEALMAVIVELRYGKEEILEAYLNEIYLGQRGSTSVHGVGEASRSYFGKPARELSVAESALLAALIQGPNAISPVKHPERALARRNLVLQLMYNQGRISREIYELAKNQPIEIVSPSGEYREVRYFLDAVHEALPEAYSSEALTTEGLKIYSTLDLRLQRIAAQTLATGLKELESKLPRRKASLQGCLLALRPQTGEVLALVGGRNYTDSQFNRCTQGRRQAGSSFKPFVYAAALEPDVSGQPVITLASFLDDTPLKISQPSGDWEPVNFDHEFHGIVSVRSALERSLNVATARLAQQVGISRVREMARRLGVESPLPSVPSLALGVADVRPIEMARAYATLVNLGVRTQVHTFEDVVDREGRLLERPKVRSERVLDAGVAYLAVSLLGGVVDRGTGRQIRDRGFEGPIGGKTGTTNDERDAWFIGFTPEIVTVVWVGFDDPAPIGLPGGRVAVPIWADFMAQATGKNIRGGFVRPENIVEMDIDPLTGARAFEGCDQMRPEIFLVGTAPDEICPRFQFPFFRKHDKEKDDSSQGDRESILDNVLRWLRGESH